MRYLVLLLVLSCATARLVPSVARPDTRRVAGVMLDSAAGMGALAIFQQALPNEGSLCFAGGARDTMIGDAHMVLLVARQASRAASDSADRFHVWYTGTSAGCSTRGLIGIAHSHPYNPPSYPCTHSVDDAYLLFADQAALFSMVFCGDGRLEVMYQDGRRISDRWHP